MSHHNPLSNIRYYRVIAFALALLIIAMISTALCFSLGVSSPVHAESPPSAIIATTAQDNTKLEQAIAELFDDINIQVQPDWLLSMAFAAIGVLIAYSIYYLRLRTIARQRQLLEEQVTERTIALKLANEELDKEIHRRAEFNRALVHELKTPLTAILASTELFVDELAGDPRLGLANNIYQAAKNLDRRTDELLDVTRGEIGLLTVSPVTSDVRSLFQTTIDTLKPAATRKRHSLTLDITGILPPIATDEDRLRQVLYNYLGNAIKYTPDGGHITLKIYQSGGELRVEVTDTGPGISAEAQKRLFEPYYQVPRNGGERLGGMGLGLSLSKMIVGLHGGRVWVESVPGKGSTFGFALPITSS
ncbi:MAG: hypothetical protein E4H31_02060 [Dehalococcoidia bacterium]|nr:MAG: hypothetical protein E4H31_02060 [Dehalococcoidia bacterium]